MALKIPSPVAEVILRSVRNKVEGFKSTGSTTLALMHSLWCTTISVLSSVSIVILGDFL